TAVLPAFASATAAAACACASLRHKASHAGPASAAGASPPTARSAPALADSMRPARARTVMASLELASTPRGDPASVGSSAWRRPSSAVSWAGDRKMRSSLIRRIPGRGLGTLKTSRWVPLFLEESSRGGNLLGGQVVRSPRGSVEAPPYRARFGVRPYEA